MGLCSSLRLSADVSAATPHEVAECLHVEQGHVPIMVRTSAGLWGFRVAHPEWVVTSATDALLDGSGPDEDNTTASPRHTEFQRASSARG